ncbi:hypothetical protein LPTSP4_27740 [Leptospira ryugenii]|uniref:DUF4386 domain-containing protein n=1 Tax=Leptospira ryugenii TaxID=1917863 RepID=A0A2P2E2W7_9LEPT|nr:DUF4386 domain-containing protein [Leptospira ryugenii]GBF51242.1 hypothetical protein LPTSP4_27740 [Leptospira ryugenii]
MNQRILAGWGFIFAAVAIQIPYTYLILNFDYPDILRKDTGEILSKFHQAGEPLVWAWFAFALLGLPLFYSYTYLNEIFKKDNSLLSNVGTFFGLSALLFQMIGLLRWVFVVPFLAKLYVQNSTIETTRVAIEISFQTQHQLFGVLLGEHIGQLFTVIWMFCFSYLFFQQKQRSFLISTFGFLSAFVYLCGQTELLTLVTNIPEIPLTGFLGSLGWLVWMIVVGVVLIRQDGKNKGI